jgi:cbb3-type cytochrome oxidase subunit 3
MVQDVLRALGGVDRYGVVSLLLFLVIFSGVIIWCLGQRKSHLDRMARLPLENELETPTRASISHEQP